MGAAAANLSRDNINCRFGIPKCLRFDNGSPFANMHVQRLLNDYEIYHVKSSPYHSQGNGQAEDIASNVILASNIASTYHVNMLAIRHCFVFSVEYLRGT